MVREKENWDLALLGNWDRTFKTKEMFSIVKCCREVEEGGTF